MTYLCGLLQGYYVLLLNTINTLTTVNLLWGGEGGSKVKQKGVCYSLREEALLIYRELVVKPSINYR